MDAVKFVEARRRMFAMTGENPKHSMFNMGTPAEEVVREVEEWATAHPRKTRQSVFLEQWPEAELDTNGAVAICPTILSSEYRSSNIRCKHPGTTCSDCRREFWMQEVE